MSGDKLAGIRDELHAALSECVGAVKTELVNGDGTEPASATRLLAHISAAQQLTTMVMAKGQETARAEAARESAGDAETDQALARLDMGRDALLSSLESLTNDLKTPA